MTLTMDSGMFQPIDAFELYDVNGGHTLSDYVTIAAGTFIASSGFFIAVAGAAVPGVNIAAVGYGLSAMTAGGILIKSAW